MRILVLIAYYNDADVIGVALDAVLQPTSAVEDERGDSRFTFYRQSENGGEYGQGRFSFQQSHRDGLFLILHDDDVLLPEFLEAGANALQAEPQAAIFVANGYAMEHNGWRGAALMDRYLRGLGRLGAREGLVNVLESHLDSGFAPIRTMPTT